MNRRPNKSDVITPFDFSILQGEMTRRAGASNSSSRGSRASSE